MFKYLFEAEYNDGTIFKQPADNRSKSHDDSKLHNTSAYGDIDHSKLVRFHLVGENRYTVDLTDGHFEINGIPFIAHEQFAVVQPPLQLIYFRETCEDRDMQGNLLNHYVNRYFIGWKAEGGAKAMIAAPGDRNVS